MSVKRHEHVGELPQARDGFVGRTPELDKISALLLGPARLITLTGPGGIGKTRLADEAVRRIHAARGIPVHWVRLARLAKDSDLGAVEEEAAQSVAGPDFSGRSAWETLIDALDGEPTGPNPRTVLVMDNCEHVLAAAGNLVAELLEAAPGSTILATSRQALGWIDERVVTVPPLSQKQALTLFLQRAELAGHPITGKDEIATANLICHHVHNHPLYIQLAAARLLRRPLAVILRELNGEADDKRLRWSHGPRVGGEGRHRRVHDVIAWSYELCSAKEQLLLDRMSVFAAGYDTNPEENSADSANTAGTPDAALDVGAELEAVEAVCADEPSPTAAHSTVLTAEEIEGLLEHLVDQSLVTLHITATAARYSLLESIQVFARQRLELRSTDDADEPLRRAERHRRYYRDKVVAAQADWFGPDEQRLLDWARAAWDNILVAVESSLTSPGQSTVGLEICTGLIAMRGPVFTGFLREIRQWTERTLAATRTPGQPSELQVTAMAMIGWIALIQGRRGDAETMLDDCVAAVLSEAGRERDWRADPASDIGLPAPVDYLWGAELMLAQCDPVSVTVLVRAREKFHLLGDNGGEAMSEMFETLAAGFLGPPADALHIARRTLDHAVAVGAQWTHSWAELAWALALNKNGKPAEALTVSRTALARQWPARDQWGAVWAVHFRMWSLAQLVADSTVAGGARDRLEAPATEIAQLAGGAAVLRARLGVNIDELKPFARETKAAVAVARRVLGDTRYVAAEDAGAQLRPRSGEVQQLALGIRTVAPTSARSPARGPGWSRWSELTAAERQVAVLAAAGWTNSSIAARRGNSFKTVDAQMTAIFQKLAITSRGNIIEFIPEDLLGRVEAERTRRPPRARGHRPH